MEMKKTLLLLFLTVTASIKHSDIGITDSQRNLTETGEDDEKEEIIKEFKPDRMSGISIKDIKLLSEELDDLNRFLKSKILGDLQSSLLIRRMEISYRMYKLINSVRKSYEANKEELRAMIDHIRTVIVLGKEHVEDKQVELTEEIMEDADALADYYNHNILIQLFEKLDENAKMLWEGLYAEVDEFMGKMKKIHHDQDKDDETKVADLLKVAVNLTVFENERVRDAIEKIKSLQDLVLNNPKYHRLAKSKDYVIPFGARKKSENRLSILLLAVLAPIAILI